MQIPSVFMQVPSQTELQIRKFPDQIVIVEITNGNFIQSWGPYQTESEATAAARCIAISLGDNVYIVPSQV
jgi:hypothetical protein